MQQFGSYSQCKLDQVVDRDDLTAQERRILDSLWRHNENEATVWKVPLGTFVNEVWVKSIHTKKLSPAVTNLVKKLLNSK